MRRPWTPAAVLLVVMASVVGVGAGVVAGFGVWAGLDPYVLFSPTRVPLGERLAGGGGLSLLAGALLGPLGFWGAAAYRRSAALLAAGAVVAVAFVLSGLVYAVRA